MKQISKRWRSTAEQWPALTFYQRFESVIAIMLTLVITVVILVALYRLMAHVFSALVFSAHNPLDNKVFQTIFGEVMTLLIALEFNHTLQYVVTREQSIIQSKIVLLIIRDDPLYPRHPRSIDTFFVANTHSRIHN